MINKEQNTVKKEEKWGSFAECEFELFDKRLQKIVEDIKEEAFQAGFRKAHKDWREANEDGWHEGYTEGSNDVLDATSEEKKGKKENCSCAEFERGLSQGRKEGFDEGYDAGFKDG